MAEGTQSRHGGCHHGPQAKGHNGKEAEPTSAHKRGSRNPHSPGGRCQQGHHHQQGSQGACLLLAPTWLWKLRTLQQNMQKDFKQKSKVRASSRVSRDVSSKEQTTFWGQKSLFHLRVGIGPMTGRAVGAGNCPFSVQGLGTGPALPVLTHILTSR